MMKVSVLLKLIICSIWVLILCPLQLNSAVKEDHPRIWLDSETIFQLQGKLDRGAVSASIITDWCNNHMDDNLDDYIDGRALQVGYSINYALLYQVTQNSTYGQRAIDIIQYTFDHPYNGYDLTLDTWIEYDNYYTDRYLVPAVAIVVDWCYDLLTENQKSRFINQLDSWCQNISTSEPWAWYDPSNNYYYGHMWALLTAAYAMYGSNSNAQNYLNIAHNMVEEGIKYTNGEEISWPHYDNTTGRANGGLWNEGTSYGVVNTNFLCAAILSMKSAENLDFPDFNFPEEYVMAYIYLTNPSDQETYSFGDGAYGGLPASSRTPMAYAVKLSDSPIKSYGQYWLGNSTDRPYQGHKIFEEFIWYDDQVTPLNYKNVLPTNYFAEGVQLFFWRDSWADDACWIVLRMGLLLSDHAHNGLGDFVIYKDGYLAMDKANETHKTMLFSEDDHNCLYISADPGEYSNGKLWWGESIIEHRVNTPNYLYYAGDLSDPFLSQPDYRNNSVDHKEREFFIVKSEKVLVILDRGTSDTQRKSFILYLPERPTLENGNYRASNGASDIIINTAYPGNTIATLENVDLERIRINTEEFTNTAILLNVIKATDSGGSLNIMPSQEANNLLATAVFEGEYDSVDYLVAFSTDPEGDPYSGSNLVIDYEHVNDITRVYIFNSEPETNYYCGSTKNELLVNLVISKDSSSGNEPVTSNSDGVLSFDLDTNSGGTSQLDYPDNSKWKK